MERGLGQHFEAGSLHSSPRHSLTLTAPLPPLPPSPLYAQGWDVAALSDQFPNFPGSCGRCYEVKCDPRWVKDG